MILSVVVLILTIYSEGTADANEQSGDCQCPSELPWPGHEFSPLNRQLLCGKELMYMVPNTTCDKEAIYSCAINETVPEFQEKCKYFCIPSSVKDCTFNNELQDLCLRDRFCHVETVMKKRMENAYGKNWRKKFP